MDRPSLPNGLQPRHGRGRPAALEGARGRAADAHVGRPQGLRRRAHAPSGSGTGRAGRWMRGRDPLLVRPRAARSAGHVFVFVTALRPAGGPGGRAPRLLLGCAPMPEQPTPTPVAPTPEESLRPDPLASAVADAVAKLRRAAGLSERAAARRLGTSQTQLRRMEDPRYLPSLRSLSRVAAAYGYRLTVEFLPQEPSGGAAPRPPKPARGAAPPQPRPANKSP